MDTVPERDAVDDQYQWELDSVYESRAAWADAIDAVTDDLAELASYQDADLTDPETLLTVLQLRDNIMRRADTISRFARMRRDEDTRDQDAQAMATRGRELVSAASEAASFIEPALQGLDGDRIDTLITEEPELAQYRHYLEDVVRVQDHTLSAAVESLLADLAPVLTASSELYDTLTNADLEFPTVEGPDGGTVQLTQSNATTHLKHPDRAFRERVHDALYDTYTGVEHTVATTLRQTVKRHVRLAHLRGYDTAREAALHGPNIPEAVYDTLLETVQENLDVLHRHLRLKQDALGVDELQMWDLYTPIVAGDGPAVPYSDAKQHVVAAVAPLGTEYQERVRDGLDAGWVDVYENRGKQSGAYSGGTYDTHPFVLMNYQDDITSMFTLAHELGHAMHSELTSEEQPYIYSDYEIFVAEVASTVNEILLTHHLLDTVDDQQFRRHVLNEAVERFRSTLYRQTLFAAFEHRIHRREEAGNPLTADAFDETYRALKATYYEPAALDDRIQHEWMRIPHFQWNFYVYQYATGISAATALAQQLLDGDSDRYLTVLRGGSSKYPVELLQDAGVDMTAADPIKAAIDTYRDRLDALEQVLD